MNSHELEFWEVLLQNKLDSDRILGFVNGYIDFKKNAIDVALVEVHPEFYGKGYCSGMVSHAIQEAMKHLQASKPITLTLMNVAGRKGYQCYNGAATRNEFYGHNKETSEDLIWIRNRRE